MESRGRYPALAIVAILAFATAAAGGGESWTPPEIRLPARGDGPLVAATTPELTRLRGAYADESDPGHAVVAGLVASARKRLADPVKIPPEGGQHNQWYQCEKCQLALKTVDAHHHRCPRCGTVYSGFPYDNVLYTHRHNRNAREAEEAALAFAVTRERPFARRAAEILLGYAERYESYEPVAATVGKRGWARILVNPWALKTYGRVLSQTLSEAAWSIPVARAFDLVHPALSEEERARIRDGLLRPLADRIGRTPLGKSNWQSWHDAALLHLGACLGDVDLVRVAILDPKNGFAFQMGAAVTGDGMWDEGSWGYHYYTLTAMTWIAEGARRLGFDLYSHPALRRMFLVGLRYRMPDGTLPRFGDDVNTRPDRPFENEAAYAAYGDPRILPGMPARPTLWSVMAGRDAADAAATAPTAATSEVFPAAGHAILRVPGEPGLAVAATFGPYGGYHGHLDKLSFVFFGGGRELGIDPGRAASQAYRLPIHRRWYKATISHDAVLVDGDGQRPAAGKLLASHLDGPAPAVLLGGDGLYPGVRWRRLLVLTDRRLVVLDELSSDRERAWTWLWHGPGRPAAPGEPVDAKPPGWAGAEFLRDVETYRPEGDSVVRFGGDDAGVDVRVVGAPGDELVTGTGPFRSVEDRAGVMALTRRGRTATFLATIEPVGADAAAADVDVGLEPDGERRILRLPGARIVLGPGDRLRETLE